MAKGRKPKPVALKVLQGNAGKRKLDAAPSLADALAEVPPAPTWLGEHAADMWGRVAPWLIESKILAKSDLHNLEAFCQAYERWRQGEADVAERGIIVPTGPNKEGKNPAVTVINEALRQMTSYGAAIGLDPAARARLKGGGEPPKENPFTLLRGGKAG